MEPAEKLIAMGFKGEVRTGEPLSGHCSLKVGGPALLLAVARDLEDLRIAIPFFEGEGMPWLVLGGGTNTLFANGGFGGCVLKLGSGFSMIHFDEDAAVLAGASAPLQALVTQAGDEGLAGLECLAGIPGTVGGAVRMNAGTGPGEISGVIEKVQIYSDGRVSWREKGKMGFAYRCSGIGRQEVVLAARFRLLRSSPEAVRRAIREHAARRRETQPLGVPSAGCWFRNPGGDSAGRLIDRAGLKGTRSGGASVSKVHANFLVNEGGATAQDFLSLARQVRDSVGSQFGVWLEEEVQVIHG